MLLAAKADDLASDNLEVALRPPMAATHVTAIKSDDHCRRHRVGWRHLGNCRCGLRHPRPDPHHAVPHRAGIRRTSDRKQLEEQVRHPGERRKRSELRRYMGQLGRDITDDHGRETPWLERVGAAAAGAYPPDPDRNVAEQRAERGRVVPLAGELRRAVFAMSHSLAHPGDLSADDLRLSGRRQPLAFIKRQAEGLQGRDIVPLDPRHLDLRHGARP